MSAKSVPVEPLVMAQQVRPRDCDAPAKMYAGRRSASTSASPRSAGPSRPASQSAAWFQRTKERINQSSAPIWAQRRERSHTDSAGCAESAGEAGRGSPRCRVVPRIRQRRPGPGHGDLAPSGRQQLHIGPGAGRQQRDPGLAGEGLGRRCGGVPLGYQPLGHRARRQHARRGQDHRLVRYALGHGHPRGGTIALDYTRAEGTWLISRETVTIQRREPAA
jgi:hypothetical protein